MIDREDEARRLQEAAANPPQLIVLRGRRRVGKSFLINRSLEGQRQIFFQADEQDEASQLRLFATEAARLLPGQPRLLFQTWDEALDFVDAQARVESLLVVLDEFQWLWNAQPALDSMLQRHWDDWQREGIPVTIVLSGSALTMMEKLLDHGSPLYGRADYRPLIDSLDYRHASAFARPGLSAEDKLRRYAVLGGTPQYQMWAGRGHLRAIIRDRILQTGESLHEDPLHLLRGEQTIRDPGTYFAVLRAIAGGATRNSEIANQAHIDTPTLGRMISRLTELGYVEHREPVEPRSGAKRATYRIRDPYFSFWFRYVFPNRSRLTRARTAEVLTDIERDLDNHMGFVFEDCCRQWVGRYATEDQMPAADQLGSWWSRNGQVEIDIVGLRNHRFNLLASCKWSAQTDTRTLGRLLEHRDHLGGPAGQAQLAIFARGFDPELIARAAEENVLLFSADDLFDRPADA